MKKIKTRLSYIVMIMVLFCVYIIPNGIVNIDYDLSKLVFNVVILFLYSINIFTKKPSKFELGFLFVILICVIFSRNINYLTFIPLLYVKNIIDDKDIVVEKLMKSKILYVCLFSTVVYSIYGIFNVPVRPFETQRFARTGIIEINQSAFSILFLGLLLYKKKKPLGIVTFILGCLTFSRLYYLSSFILMAFHFLRGKFKKFHIEFKKPISYAKWNLCFFLILMLLGVAYVGLYNYGLIKPNSEINNRLLVLFDYSNLYRFTANILVILIFIYSPKYLLFGMSDKVYLTQCTKIAKTKLSIPYAKNIPHNLFLSHLKIYGFIALIELLYTSYVLKNIINKKNISIFIVIFITSNILGCGLYSYWLYLSVLVLTTYMNDKA